MLERRVASQRGKRVAWRWTMIAVVVLALILAPFVLFGARLDDWSTAFLDRSIADAWGTRVLVISLLAADIFLPVPSSAVSTFAGVSLGFQDGFITSTIGMSLGCILGYAAGRFVGRPATARFVGAEQTRRLESLSQRWGDWVLVVTRAVPVLAEASALVAGVGRVRFRRYVVITTFANAGISMAYAAVGAFAANLSSFLLAVAGAVALPGVALLIERRIEGTSSRARAEPPEPGPSA